MSGVRDVTTLRVGIGRADITPALGISMQGYGRRSAEAVSDRLFVNALAVGRERAEWLLFCVDSIGVDHEFTARLRESLARSHSIAPSAVTVACSHTHSGPATLRKLGVVDGDDAYLSFLHGQLTSAADAAIGALQDVRWRFGTTSLPENVNRRQRRGGRIELGVDDNRHVDNRLRVIRIDRLTDPGDAPPLALLVHYTCHPTMSSGVPVLSADWPGAMRTVLESVYDGARRPVVFFLQGCAGDITHRIGRDPNAWPEHFEKYTNVQAQVMGRLTAAAAVLASERAVTVPADTVASIAQSVTLRYQRHPGEEQTEAQVIRIGASDRSGQSLWIVALPGEPFSEYGASIADVFRARFAAGTDTVLVCGYCNDAVGYLCTSTALREGGYEADRAHQMYHRPAPFDAATESDIREIVTQAAGQLNPAGGVRATVGAPLMTRALTRLLSGISN